jgi:hypothetical protein
MKTILLAVAAATFVVPACASAERLQDAQRIMEIDLQTCMRPDFPAAALAEGAEGKTTVEFQIGAQGRVLEARGRIEREGGPGRRSAGRHPRLHLPHGGRGRRRAERLAQDAVPMARPWFEWRSLARSGTAGQHEGAGGKR